MAASYAYLPRVGVQRARNMIYVTVGTQLSFDRLVLSVDDWASRNDQSVFAQVGPSDEYFTHISSSKFVSPEEADRRISEAELIVAHAGMGTIIAATQYGKPLIIMPRQFKLSEHRNDHQVSTAKRFNGFSNIEVVNSREELNNALDNFFSGSLNLAAEKTSHYAPDSFIVEVRKLLT